MAEAKIYVPATSTISPARTYNQVHHAPQVHAGRRRVSIYVCWSYPGEANRDIVGAGQPLLDDDRGAPRGMAGFWESPEWSDPTMFQQGIAGALELFFRAWMPFQQLVGGSHRHRGAGVSARRSGRLPAAARRARARRHGHAARLRPRPSIDGTGSVSRGNRGGAALAHARGHRAWSSGRTTMSGISADLNERPMEYAHHGDALVPRQQRFGKYTRSLMKGSACRSKIGTACGQAVVEGTRQIAPLTINRDLDTRGWLERRDELQLPQAPAALRGHRRRRASRSTSSAASRSICPSPHPFTEAGNREFNSFVWMPPDGRARRRGSARRLDDIQHAVRRRRQLEAFLEEPRVGHDEFMACDCRPPRSVDRPLCAVCTTHRRTRGGAEPRCLSARA